MNTALILPEGMTPERKAVAERILAFLCQASDEDVGRVDTVIQTTISIRSSDAAKNNQ